MANYATCRGEPAVREEFAAWYPRFSEVVAAGGLASGLRRP